MSRDQDFRKFLSKSRRVYIIGVAGDSGSGKSTFTSGIKNMLGEDLVATISLDDYHLYGREERASLNITPLNPAANDLARLERDVAQLKKGSGVEKMRYNHATGTLEGPEHFAPAKVIILEGLHTLSTPALRKLLDFSFFVDPSPDVKREWKLKRDMGSRGYTEKEVQREMSVREPDYLAYVAPQKAYAQGNIGISFSRFGRELGWRENIYRVSLSMAPLPELHEKVLMTFDLGSVIYAHTRPYSVGYMPVMNEGHHMGTLELDGGFPCDAVRELFSRLREQTGIDPGALIPTCPLLTPTDIMQLIVCWRIIAHRLMLD